MLIQDAITQESFRRAQGLLTVPPQNPQSPDISSVCVSQNGDTSKLSKLYMESGQKLLIRKSKSGCEINSRR